METTPCSVEEHLGDIPAQLATFHEFKQKLINQSTELQVTADAINAVMKVVESQFLKPLAQTIDRVLVNAKVHLVSRTESEKYFKKIICTHLDKQRIAYDEQRKVMEENYQRRITELENELKQFKPEEKNSEPTMATPQKKAPEAKQPAKEQKETEFEEKKEDVKPEEGETSDKTQEIPSEKNDNIQKTESEKSVRINDEPQTIEIESESIISLSGESSFYDQQLVETVIRYGPEEEVWIDATINGYNADDSTYNLMVLDPEKYSVNPEAVHVPENLVRVKKRLKKRRSTKKRKKPAIDLLNEADESGNDAIAGWSTKKKKAPIVEPTSGDMGCYLTVKVTGDKYLMLNWSKEPVPGAFLFFRPRKKVPGFKFKNNKGQEELMRNLNQQRFYMGCTNFFKLAQQFEADIVQLEDGFDGETWPIKYLINNDTFLFPVPRFEFFDTTYSQNVVCVHEGNSTFDGISKQPVTAFVTAGNNQGYATALKPKKVGAKKKKRKSRKKL